MKIEQFLEDKGFRLLITLESKDLISHSKMQSLPTEDVETLKNTFLIILSQITSVLAGTPHELDR